MSAEESWTPAFEGQRPPFPPGNDLAVTHGAYSPKVVEPIAREIVSAVLADPDVSYLQAASYAPSLWRWGLAEARVQRYADVLANHDCAGCRKCAGWDEKLRRWITVASNLSDKLGLSPLARGRLGRDVATAAALSRSGLSQLMAQGPGLVQAHERGDGNG